MSTTTHTTPQAQQAPTSATARQLVSFGFYRLDPSWRRLGREVRRKQADELCGVTDRYAKQLKVLTYSLVGLKADVDFLVWCVGTSLEELQKL